jgi:regulatory protein
MRPPRARKSRSPLDPAQLHALALAYVGRFATTRAKLRAYLARKVREHGWEDGGPPDLDEISDSFARQGYVDDAAYAVSKSRGLIGRGYGPRRVDQALRSAGIEEGDGSEARELAREQAADAALRFAQRRRFGPFARSTFDLRDRERAIAAMVRAGHDVALARAIVSLNPSENVDPGALADTLR